MNDVTKDLLEALKGYVSFGCPVCGGDCYSANPPQTFCLVKQACDAIARAEAALAEPQPDADGWIPWAGGDNYPQHLNPLASVEAWLRCGKQTRARAAVGYDWSLEDDEGDIIAYRVVKP